LHKNAWQLSLSKSDAEFLLIVTFGQEFSAVLACSARTSPPIFDTAACRFGSV
jgi:hypothetical protein